MDKRQKILKSIVMIILFYLINFYGWDFVVNNGWLEPHIASFIDYLLLFIIAILLFKKELKGQWKDFKEELGGKFFLKIIIWAILGVVLSSVFVYLGSMVFQDAGVTQNQESLNQMSKTLPPLITLMMMSIFAPVIEELTFRHSFLSPVSENNKLLLTILTILSIIAFDKIHIADPFTMPSKPVEFFYYFGLTLSLTSFYYYGKRNIWYSISLHSFLNFSGFILMYLGIM